LLLLPLFAAAAATTTTVATMRLPLPRIAAAATIATSTVAAAVVRCRCWCCNHCCCCCRLRLLLPLQPLLLLSLFGATSPGNITIVVGAVADVIIGVVGAAACYCYHYFQGVVARSCWHLGS
jgi:hypothetical protein